MSALPMPFYTPQQYIELEETAEGKSEYVGGQVFAMAGGSPEHSAIGTNVASGLSARLRRGPCQVFNSDLRVTVMQTGLKTYPDVTVVCGEQHRHPPDRNSIINPAVLFRSCRRPPKRMTGCEVGLLPAIGLASGVHSGIPGQAARRALRPAGRRLLEVHGDGRLGGCDHPAVAGVRTAARGSLRPGDVRGERDRRGGR